MTLLDVRDLSVTFWSGRHPSPVVSDVSLSIGEGEIVGLVGESGSGKSVTGLALMGLHDPRVAEVRGSATLDGTELIGMPERGLRQLRGSSISMIFQEPMTALDPVDTIGSQLTETIRTHLSVSRREARDRAIDLLRRVGIGDAERRFGAYPFQMSGGMRQRVVFALALACRPRLVIADEPTTAVDVTIQAQLLKLLVELADEVGTAVLLITHDLGVVAEVCQRMYTMYGGRVVESGTVDGVLDRPRHPYTAGLLSAIPRPSTIGSRLQTIPGRVPPPGSIAQGCVFEPRCRFARPECAIGDIPLFPVGDGSARCIRADELVLEGAL